ncbi:MAG: LPP20 family lipoprotein [Nitrospirales bacterium]
MMVGCLLVLPAVLGGLVGCAGPTHHSTPDWVHDPTTRYPVDQYLTGLGRADSPESAAGRAYGAVARIFQAEVSQQSRDWESFLVFENRGTQATERRLTVDQVTRVSTDKALEQVKILETWRDSQTGLSYALAGLNRGQAGAALRERLEELDAQVEQDVQTASQSQDLLTHIKWLRRAIKALALRDAHNADLRVISASGRGIPAAYSVTKLTAELETLLRQHLVVGVEVSGTEAETVRRAVIEGLLTEGLPVTAKSVTAPFHPEEGQQEPLVRLLAQGTVRLAEIKVPDPRFTYVRWCAEFTIRDSATQRVVAAVSSGGREGHVTQEEARAKALRVIQQEATSGLVRTLAAYVYGETPPEPQPPPAACVRDSGGANSR